MLNDPLTGLAISEQHHPESADSHRRRVKLLSYRRFLTLMVSSGTRSISRKTDCKASANWIMFINPKHSFVFRIFESDGNQPFHSPPDNIHAARYSGYRDSLSATLGHTFVVNPTTVIHTQLTGAHQLAEYRD